MWIPKKLRESPQQSAATASGDAADDPRMAPATDDRRRYGKAARDDDFNAERFGNYDLTLRIRYADYTSVSTGTAADEKRVRWRATLKTICGRRTCDLSREPPLRWRMAFPRDMVIRRRSGEQPQSTDSVEKLRGEHFADRLIRPPR